MAATAKDINFRIAADASAFLAATETAEQRFQRFKTLVSDQNAAEKAGAGQIAGISKTAAFGLDVAGIEKFAAMTAQAKEFATAVRTGGTASHELGKIVNQIPIVGQFKQAGEAIRELITGQQAAIIQANKLGQAAEGVALSYHKLAMDKEIRGKRGDERSEIEIAHSVDAKQQALNDKAEALKNRRNEIESNPERFSVSNGPDGPGVSYDPQGHYTKAQQDELDSITKQEKAINEARTGANADGSAAMKIQKKEEAQRAIEFDRTLDEQIFAAQAANKEKALRKQGKGIESALVAIDANTDRDKRSRKAEFDDFKVEGTDPKEIQRRKAKVAEADAIQAAQAESTKASLREEYARRQLEKTKGNEEEVSKIKAEANIERLRASGQAYQAEIAQAKEAYREKIVELDTKSREEHKGDALSGDDQKTLADAKKAEAMKRDAAIDNAGMKEGKRSSDAEVGIEKELSRLRLERLKQEAENGDANAERMLREGAIREKAKGDQLEIGKLLRDHNTTFMQRLQLVKLLDQSLTDEKKSLAKAQGDDRTGETRFELKDAGYQTVFGQAGTPDSAAQKADTVANASPQSVAELIGTALAAKIGEIIKLGFSGVSAYSGPNNDGGSSAGGD